MKYVMWISVLLMSFLLYLYWGASAQLITSYKVNAEVKKIKSEIASSGSIDVLIKKMEKQVQKSPDDPQGHYLLAKLYLSDKKIDKALESFEKANTLKPNDPEIMVNYAQALFLNDNRQLNPMAKSLVDDVLKIDMQNMNALNLLGMDAYNHKHYKEAIGYWERVLIQLPLNGDDAKQVEEMIKQARSQI